MPLSSVQPYLKGLLDGMPVPSPSGGSQTLTAWVTPPTVEDLDGPRAYVWGGRQHGRRQTMPRAKPNEPETGGFRRIDHTIDIYLVYLANPDDVELDQEFPLLIDAVLAQLWNAVMPTKIADATTGVVSQVLELGEDWEIEYPPVHAPATQRMVYYSCRIAMDVQEAVQG